MCTRPTAPVIKQKYHLLTAVYGNPAALTNSSVFQGYQKKPFFTVFLCMLQVSGHPHTSHIYSSKRTSTHRMKNIEALLGKQDNENNQKLRSWETTKYKLKENKKNQTRFPMLWGAIIPAKQNVCALSISPPISTGQTLTRESSKIQR